jgi:hypothetical protein
MNKSHRLVTFCLLHSGGAAAAAAGSSGALAAGLDVTVAVAKTVGKVLPWICSPL